MLPDLSMGQRFRSRQNTQGKIIETLLHGIKPSLNQVERVLCEIFQISSKEYTRVHNIQNDTYLNDCLTGESQLKTAMQ